MPKDFAARGRTRAHKRPPAKRKKTNQKRTLFHGPSFSSGAIVGGAIVILAAYAPEFLSTDSASPEADGKDPIITRQPLVEFEFPKVLKEQEILADPKAYEVPEPPAETPLSFYTIQAASFRNGADAETLRADLILNDLPAQIDTRLVSDKVWFRVTVGPFPRKVEADRAMTRLRDMRLIPIWLNNDSG